MQIRGMKILNAAQIQEQELSALLSSGEDGIRQRAPVSFKGLLFIPQAAKLGDQGFYLGDAEPVTAHGYLVNIKDILIVVYRESGCLHGCRAGHFELALDALDHIFHIFLAGL
jgi:hypothetical protein